MIRRPFPLTRLVSVLGLFGAALIVAATAAAAWSERSRLFRDAAVRAESTAAFLADHAARLFEVADVALSATRAEIGTTGWDDLGRAQGIQQQLRAISQALPYVSNIWLNDDRGLLRLTSLAFPTPPSDASDRLSFRQVSAPGSGLVVGDLITAKITGEQTFLVARRLEWPDRSFRGMVSATAQLDYFVDYWKHLTIDYRGQVALLPAASDVPLVAYGGADDPAAYAGAGNLVAMAPVANVPLRVRLTLPRGAVLDAWHAWLRTTLPLAEVALLALVGLTAFAFRQGRREAATLSVLAKAREELAGANAGLEATVARRTAALRETSDEVRRFAYLVSHDLRGPLLNVTGFAGELGAMRPALFAAEPLPPAERSRLAIEFDEMLGFIRASTVKMDTLLRHILALSREGQRMLAPEPLDMTALVRGLADAQRFQAEQLGASVTVHPLPGIVADRLAVEQIFSNLLDNAVKYLDEGRRGVVEVSGNVEGDEAHFTVADNGRGIAEADRERVFELFRRGGARDVPGEGIGLSFVRTLARLLGGQVDLHSTEGVGSTFRVSLPRRPFQA